MAEFLSGAPKLWSVDESPEKQQAAEFHKARTSGHQAEKREEPKNQQQQIDKDFTETVDEVEEGVSRAIPQQYHDGLPPTIYIVPRDLAEGNIRAYTPSAVCIGPLFYSKRETANMQKLQRYKWCCVRKLIVGRHPAGEKGPVAWTPELHAPLLRKCLKTMRDLVPRIRASYSIEGFMDTIVGSNEAPGPALHTDTDTMANWKEGPSFLLAPDPEHSKSQDASCNQLALMMLLDGCFVLHRLLKHARAKGSAEENGSSWEDDADDDDWTQVFGRCGIWGIVKCDLLLLHNQIPFFILQALFEHLKRHAVDRDEVLVKGSLQMFSSLHPHRLQSSPMPIACRDVHHLLHLFYLSIDLPKSSQAHPQQSTRRHALPTSELPQWVPCAKELEEAGVTFRARKAKDGAVSFLDVKFSGGVLEIPPLELYDYSEPLFRNLIAFEQTYPATQGHVTAYAIFMDCLVKTHEDMRLLHQSGVLVNHMNGKEDAATGFFSRICAQVQASADLNYLAGTMEEINRYQSARWPRWRAALVRNYFSNPWVTTSFVAAFFLLVMTVLQTFFSVYGYFKPAH